MQALVTGGTGFIGTALCGALVARGHTVWVLSRNPSPDRIPAGCDGLRSLEDLPPDAAPQWVINLAGENLGRRRWTAARKQQFVDSRVETTRDLVKWMSRTRQRPDVLVSGSAVGYYGARGDEPVDEDDAPGDEYQSRLCTAWEEAALRAEGLGVRTCRLRIGIVLGHGGALRSMLPAFRLGLGGHFGDGRQWMSWIHLDDLVALILWLASHESESGAYNATAPAAARNREFARTLARVLRRPAWMGVPAVVVRLMVGEMAHLLLTGQQVLPQRTRSQGFEFRHPDLEPALRDLFP